MQGYCPVCQEYVEAAADELQSTLYGVPEYFEPYCPNCQGDVYHKDADSNALGEVITSEDVAEYYAPDV